MFIEEEKNKKEHLTRHLTGTNPLVFRPSALAS